MQKCQQKQQLTERVSVYCALHQMGEYSTSIGTSKILIQLAENHHNSTNLKPESLQENTLKSQI